MSTPTISVSATSSLVGVTGGTGFVGRALVGRMLAQGHPLRCLDRGQARRELSGVSILVDHRPTTFDGEPIDPCFLGGCTTVIHIAARAHRTGERGAAALAAYRRTNVGGTTALISAMVAAGVRRLVYISSIKAVGECSFGRPLGPGDARHPEDPYGRSKAEAEDVVAAACAAQRIEAVILRPVLIHGPGAQGNLRRLLERVGAEAILPLGSVRNRRSLIGVDNLTDAILKVAIAPWPGDYSSDGQTLLGGPVPCAPRVYHIADTGVVSTRRLIEVLAEGMGVKLRLINLPRWLAIGGATLLGKGAVARRLYGDLEVDDSDFRRDFNWKPCVGLEDGLKMMAANFICP